METKRRNTTAPLTPRVLTVGPDMKALGGIASVEQSYSRTLPDFRLCPTNSRHGTIAGLFSLAVAMVRIPLFRLAGYNIIHAQGAAGKSFYRKRLVLKWARMLGFRTIYHCHAGVFPKFAAAHGSVAPFMRSCDALAVLSPTWKRYYTETLGCDPSRVYVINNIVEPPRVPVERTFPAPSPQTPLRLLFLGKICREKGLYDLVDAAALEADRFRGVVKISIAGRGEDAPLREHIVRLGVGDIVEYVGPKFGADKEEALRRNDIVILPSYIEGLPITLLEAGVYLMPSIATRIGGIPDLITDGVNGTLVDTAAPRQIADAILGYLDNPGRIRQQGEAAARMVEPFLPDAVARSLSAMYSAVLNNSPKP